MKKIYVLIIAICIMNIAKGQWVQTNNPLGGPISKLAISGTNIYAATYGEGIFVSTNDGNTWSLMNTGIPINNYLYALTVDDSTFFAGTDSGVYLSTNFGNSWFGAGITDKISTSFAINGSNIFVGTNAGIYLTTNNGSTWSIVNNGLTDTIVQVLAINGNNIFAGTYGGGMFLSTNNGNTWSAMNNGLPTGNVVFYSLAISGNNIFAGTNCGVYLSTNNGLSWDLENNGLPPAPLLVYDFSISGNTILAGTTFGVYQFSNNTNSWSAVNTGLTDSIYGISTLAIKGNYIFCSALGKSIWKRPLSDFTGLLNNTSNNFLSLYISPNPATNSLTLNLSQLKNFQNTTVSIYDIQGKQLFQQNIKQAQTEIDIAAFTKGIYIIKVYNDSNTMQSKFIKE